MNKLYSRSNLSGTGLSHEKNFNLLYITKNHHPNSKGSFLKKETESSFSNILIWDIQKKEKSAIFSEQQAKTERIQTFIFEELYDEKEQQIIFNGNPPLLNNFKIPFRHPRNLLLLETYNASAEQRNLWTCDKHGNELKKIASLSNDSNWHLDVGNSLLRILKHSSTNVDITEINW